MQVTRKIGKGIHGLVGLGQEAHAHRQEKKASAALKSDPNGDGDSDFPPSYNTAVNDEDYEDDEDDWVADDAQAALDSEKSDISATTLAAGEAEETAPEESQEDSKAKADTFITRYGHPPSVPVAAGSNPLPAPVLIPQSRPKMRTRGFVRAYAPALADAGVDETAFLEFLKGFDQQIGKQGWFNATNLAIALSVLSYTAAVAPSAIVSLVSRSNTFAEFGEGCALRKCQTNGCGAQVYLL